MLPTPLNADFEIGDSVIAYAAECRGLTNGVILNMRTGKRGHKEYLVTTSFYIEWIRLTVENRYNKARLATPLMPVQVPNSTIVRRDDLPLEHTIEHLGNWNYVASLLEINPPKLADDN